MHWDLVSQTRARVAYGQANEFSGSGPAFALGAGDPGSNSGGVDAQDTAPRHGIAGIGNQTDSDVLNQTRVRQDRWQLETIIALKNDPSADQGAESLAEFFKHPIEVQPFPLQCVAAAHHQQLAR
jgi:hypothetical protein